jgi:hypothetical protein
VPPAQAGGSLFTIAGAPAWEDGLPQRVARLSKGSDSVIRSGSDGAIESENERARKQKAPSSVGREVRQRGCTMNSYARPMLAWLLLASMSGAASAQTTPATRACQTGERMVGGVCQPLTGTPDRPSTNSPQQSNTTGSTGGATTGNQNTGGSGGQSGGSSGGAATGNQNTGGSGGQGGGTSGSGGG